MAKWVADVMRPITLGPLVIGSAVINGLRTSLRLETSVWKTLEDVAKAEECAIGDILNAVDAILPANGNLSSALRVFLLEYHRLKLKLWSIGSRSK